MRCSASSIRLSADALGCCGAGGRLERLCTTRHRNPATVQIGNSDFPRKEKLLMLLFHRRLFRPVSKCSLVYARAVPPRVSNGRCVAFIAPQAEGVIGISE